MQLSSVLLSATALLAQAASGFYLTWSENTVGGPEQVAGFAGSHIGFYHAETTPASIELDDDGYLTAESNMAFFEIGDGSWRFERRPSNEANAQSIQGPFSEDGYGQFLYRGGSLQWALCQHPNDSPGFAILLGDLGTGGEWGDCRTRAKLYTKY